MVGKLREHLFIYGIDKSYSRWIWHGKSARGDTQIISTDERKEVDYSEDDQL